MSIRDFSLEELNVIMESLDQPKYRASQVYEWLHSHNITSYDEMTNIPKSIRQSLSEKYPLESVNIIDEKESDDGSVKLLLGIDENTTVETVAIKSYTDKDFERVTVCVSSQAGCAMECEFCATGKSGFSRNLNADEIVLQVSSVISTLKCHVSNVVVMGQGEPFLNYDNVISAMRRLNQDEVFNIGARHITVSTSGIVDGIYAFANEPEQFRLAVSLHSADQRTRNKLMPRLSGQPLHSLKKALEFYCTEKGRRVTLEYLLLKNVNDDEEHLEKLINFCKGLNVHINLLEYNPVDKTGFLPSSSETYQFWVDRIQESEIVVSIRKSKGRSVLGACGQLSQGKREPLT